MRTLLFSLLLTAGLHVAGVARPLAPPAPAAGATAATPPRAPTVLAVAVAAPLPANLAAPLGAAQHTPQVLPTRTADMSTTRWILLGLSTAGLVLLAVTAANK